MTSFHQLAMAGRERAEEHYPTLVRVYEQELRRLGREARVMFQRAAEGRPVTAAASPWPIPDADEVLNIERAVQQMNRKTGNVRAKIAEASIAGTLAEFGVDFDLSNPLLQGVIAKMGNKITNVTESARSEIMQAIQDGYDQGLSIRDTGKLITKTMNSIAKTRAEMITRTELTAGTSGASYAAAKLVTEASPPTAQLRKIWIATDDDRTREAHVEAGDTYSEGNGIPLDQPFIVDDEPLLYPGDDGSPENVINCRCAVGYEQSGALGAVTASAAPGARWLSQQGPRPVQPARGVTMALSAPSVPPSSTARMRRLLTRLEQQEHP